MCQTACALTDGGDELFEDAEGKQRLWKLPQEKLESAGDHVNLLPLSVLQVQVLLCRNRGQLQASETKLQIKQTLGSD